MNGLTQVAKYMEESLRSAIEEFSQRIVSNYENVDPAGLEEIWNEVVEDLKITVEFKGKPAPKNATSTNIQSAPFSEGGCPHEFKRGERMGEICGIRPKDGRSYCSRHIKNEGVEPKEKKIMPKITQKKPIVKKATKKADTTKRSPDRVLYNHKKLSPLLHHRPTDMLFRDKNNVIGKCVDDILVFLTEKDRKICEDLNFTIDDEWTPDGGWPKTDEEKIDKEHSETDDDSEVDNIEPELEKVVEEKVVEEKVVEEKVVEDEVVEEKVVEDEVVEEDVVEDEVVEEDVVEEDVVEEDVVEDEVVEEKVVEEDVVEEDVVEEKVVEDEVVEDEVVEDEVVEEKVVAKKVVAKKVVAKKVVAKKVVAKKVDVKKVDVKKVVAKKVLVKKVDVKKVDVKKVDVKKVVAKKVDDVDVDDEVVSIQHIQPKELLSAQKAKDMKEKIKQATMDSHISGSQVEKVFGAFNDATNDFDDCEIDQTTFTDEDKDEDEDEDEDE
jgi:hypothetical protein